MNTETVAEQPPPEESSNKLTRVQLVFDLGKPVTVVVQLQTETCNTIRQVLYSEAVDSTESVSTQENPAPTEFTSTDSEQYVHLVDTHYERVYSYFYSIYRNTMDAEDHTQDTFLRLLKNIHTLETPSLHSNWLMRTARNLRIQTYRKKSNLDESLQTDREDLYPDPHPGIEHQLINSQEDETFRKMFVRLLHELPDDSKTMVWLFYFQGLKQRTIADIFEVDVQVIKSRLFRIKVNLANRYLLAYS